MLRDFVPADRADYVCLSQAFYSTDAVIKAVPEQCFYKTFDAILEKSPYIRGLMFEQNGELAGYALLSFTFSAEVGGLVVLIEEIYILPQFQGQGLGSELFHFVELEYPDKVRRLRLEVTRGNAGAIQLYRRMGFQELDYLQMIKDFA